MRQVTRKGLMTVAAATGVLAVTGGYAHADAGANGSAMNSPGVLSGNVIQAPVHVPVNVCGNTVNVIGLLNPAAGNTCVNEGGGSHTGGSHTGGSHTGGGGSHAGGHTSDSQGVGSGNNVQAPVDVPVNVCGNSVNMGGLGNGAVGNDCANTPGGGDTTTPPGGGQTPPPGGGHQTPPGGGHQTPPGGGGGTTPPGTPRHPGQPGQPSHPGTPQQPGSGGSRHVNHPGAHSVTQPAGAAQLAHTGSDLPLGVLVPAGAGALLGGALLYRRARANA